MTVLSGSLGAGKTTLLNGLLEAADSRDVAVLVNDMGEVNVDADLVSRGTGPDTGRVAELSNGCICCELRGDLETAVVRLARERNFSHLVVEPSGISEPEPVATLFDRGSSAAALYDVDAVVTVVDARQFYDALADRDAEGTPAEGVGDDEPRPLSDLLVEQVEFADVVVLNKTDLVDDDERRTVRETVAALRPGAETVETTFSVVDPDRVLDRGLFDPAARESDDAGHDHEDGHDHSHPEEEYGVDSFVYRRRQPLHPERFATLASDLPDAVVRSKGVAWVAGRDDVRLEYSQAGPSVRVEASGRWIASLPAADRELYLANRSDVDWDETAGDRQTELVFIGQGLDESALTDALDGCLVDQDTSVEGARRYPAAAGESVTFAP